MNRSAQKTITAAEMQALERAAMASGRISGFELMERAGRGVVEAIFARWPDVASHPVAEVLCGPGNNGGDGYVIARLLREQGWDVVVVQVGDAGRLPPDAAGHAALWEGPVVAHDAPFPSNRKAPGLMVDAVFGIGLNRPIEDAALWEWFWLIDDAQDARVMAEAGRPGPSAPPVTVAIDLPSGLDADSGAVIGGNTPEHGLRAPRVDLTVTFHAKKPAHLRGAGAELCGEVVVVDIGLGDCT